MLAWSSCAFAQPTAAAPAVASTQNVEPDGILAADGGTTVAATGATGAALVSAGRFSIQGQANQVVSVTAALPSSVQRVDGDEALPVTASAASSRVLGPSGVGAFAVAGGVSLQGAPAGLYAGTGQVLVNLN